jgi:P-type Mg2+ transporter
MNQFPRLARPIWSAPEAQRAIGFAAILGEVAALDSAEVYERMKSSPEGLTPQEAAQRWEQVGPNVVAAQSAGGWPWRLLRAVRNPLVILLCVLASISFATGDLRSGTVMALMVILGVLLRFVQETRADVAAEKLKAMIHVTATVVRGGQEAEIALRELVPGDVVKLSAGDMIPADVRLVGAKDLFVSQGTLTDGERESLFFGDQRGKRRGDRGHCGHGGKNLLWFHGGKPGRGAGTDQF